MVSLVAINRDGVIQDPLPLSEAARRLCGETVAWYGRSEFVPPWIGYLAQRDGAWVGVCGFKGAPRDGRVEIAYGTFEERQGRGVATEAVQRLLEIAYACDPGVRITAQTLPRESPSTSVLRKSAFVCCRTIQHPEDGEVWEWELPRAND